MLDKLPQDSCFLLTPRPSCDYVYTPAIRALQNIHVARETQLTELSAEAFELVTNEGIGVKVQERLPKRVS